MLTRLRKLLLPVSAACLAVTVALWVGSYRLVPGEHHIPFSDALQVGLWRGGVDVRLVSLREGRIVDPVGADPRHPKLQDMGIGDAWGIGYRRYHWPNSTLRMLTFSMLYPVALFGFLPALSILGQARQGNRLRRGLCPACGYPAAASIICSECGVPR